VPPASSVWFTLAEVVAAVNVTGRRICAHKFVPINPLFLKYWEVFYSENSERTCNNLRYNDPHHRQKATRHENLKTIYRVIHKSLREFRPLRYSSRDGNAEGEHVNRGRDTPRFCPTLQVLDMFTLGDAADVNPVIKFLSHTVNHVA
jgi:hypothetical protein